MKQIIITIIMLVSSFASGQNDVIGLVINHNNKPVKPPMERSIYSFIEQYQAYKKECLNDSTLVIKYRNPEGAEHYHPNEQSFLTNEIYCSDRHPVKTWKKKNHDSLEGFVEWLNSKASNKPIKYE